MILWWLIPDAQPIFLTQKIISPWRDIGYRLYLRISVNNTIASGMVIDLTYLCLWLLYWWFLLVCVAWLHSAPCVWWAVSCDCVLRLLWPQHQQSQHSRTDEPMCSTPKQTQNNIEKQKEWNPLTVMPYGGTVQNIQKITPHNFPPYCIFVNKGTIIIG